MKTTARTPQSSLAKTVAALGVLIFLSGCGGLGVQEDWNARASLPALPTSYREVAAADLARVCGNHPGMKLYGCAKRDFKARTCTIVTGPTPAAWLLEHERKHCAGFDHDAQDNKVRTAAAGFPGATPL